MAKICLSLTGSTLDRDLEILEKYRKYVDVAELRVDFLDPDERLHIRRFPEMAGIPVILTIRRDTDGGKYVGGEASRITLFSMGLAFAEVDKRKNFAYVDIESDLNVPSLEEAARTFGTKIIRSIHNFQGVGEDLPKLIRELRRTGDEIAKVAMMPQSTADVLRIYQAARETKNVKKILIGMGRFGASTRILADYLGSHLTYSSVTDEDDLSLAAPGQLSPKELVELYRFKKINKDSKIFGITGYPLTATSSPAFHNALFTQEQIDAVYIPFPSDSINSFLRLAEEINMEGASVTVPYKESIIPNLSHRSDRVEHIGACNTIIRSAQGWMGYNTDGLGFSDALLKFVGKKNLRGKRVTIIGAGGAARAVAAEVARLKGRALILNRTVFKAKELALRYGFAWGGLDHQGMEMLDHYSHIIIQTTSVGMEPNIDADPLDQYYFSGKEMVMDLIYKPAETRLLTRAKKAGCLIANGSDMLVAQAKYQYNLFMRTDLDNEVVTKHAPLPLG
ncbi:MAG: shikimate dehydrogenase [Treponema sp.]|jgi:3-dehydroquinate dehydratase/shikimate dehydrogenase|nr:shikimate dehydrogenase [Treponema sp.]